MPTTLPPLPRHPVCPHCLARQSSQAALGTHLQFQCPALGR